MNNEMSFESIFNAGMGIAPVAKVENSVSVEAFDGSFDSAFADLARSEEELNFLETFESVENYNSASKIKMLSKINKEYGKCNRGIESYVQSLEANEVDGTSAIKADTTNEAVADAPKTWKHAKWLQTALNAVAKFFVKIWTIIKNFFIKIGTKIHDFFTKKKNDKIASKAEASKAEAKLVDLIKETNKNIDRLQPKVRMIEREINKFNKEFDKFNMDRFSNLQNPNNEVVKKVGYRWYSDISIVTGSSLKLLSQMGKVILKAGQALMNTYAKDASKVAIKGSSQFADFVGRYSKITDTVVSITKTNFDKLKKFDDQTTSHQEKNKVIEEKRKALGETAYSVYKDTSDMAKKYFNYTAPTVTRTDFTSPSTSGKKMSDVISKMTKGLSDAWTDDKVPVAQRYILKNLFGIEFIA